MSKLIDLTGERFGKLVVNGRINVSNKGAHWDCICDCGNHTTVSSPNLRNGRTKSCGCLAKEMRSKRLKTIKQETRAKLEGKRFSRLLVLSEVDKRSTDGEVIWLCVCDCGKNTYVKTSNLLKGITRSCGCYGREKQIESMKLIDGTSIVALTKKIGSNNTSGVKGVKWHKSSKKWMAQINFKGKRYHLGSFHSLEEAAQARRIAEDKLFGEFLEWYNEEFKQEGAHNEQK